MKTHDYFGMRANIGLVFAFDPITVLAVAATVTAATAVTTGVLNYEASQAAAGKADSLANEQASELAAQQQQQADAAAAEAVGGATFGQGSAPAPKTIATGLGFGSGTPTAPTNSTGLGRAALTGPGGS